eukprot:scaffold7767_cov149-Amphora_coffeaeformis.AAC.4
MPTLEADEPKYHGKPWLSLTLAGDSILFKFFETACVYWCTVLDDDVATSEIGVAPKLTVAHLIEPIPML